MTSIERLQLLFIDYLHENRFEESPQMLYQPVNYIMELGGKRMRPVLLLMAYELFNENVEAALPAAYAIEIFHNFSLVHDDIMDEAPLRRGKPTVHEKYDINTGILSGDIMLIYAYEFLMKTENRAITPDLVRLFNHTAIKVCEGQQMDMDFETRNDVSIEEYIQMISHKTAALIAGGMKMGAKIAGADKKDAELIYQFAWNIGIAFQLQDDILDTFGDPEKFGKKVGGDIIQNKKTYLVLKAIELGNDSSNAHLRSLMIHNDLEEKDKILNVRSIFESLDVRKEAEKEKRKYQDLAFEALKSVSVNSLKKKTLIDLANQLLGRES